MYDYLVVVGQECDGKECEATPPSKWCLQCTHDSFCHMLTFFILVLIGFQTWVNMRGRNVYILFILSNTNTPK